MSDQLIELIFITFSRRFTHKWATAFEDKVARQLWRGDLNRAGITDELIKHGLKACAELDWPPSTGEFIKICKANNKKEYYKQLPRPKQDEQTRIIAVEKMREILKCQNM